jgi:hypothetical protein
MKKWRQTAGSGAVLSGDTTKIDQNEPVYTLQKIEHTPFWSYKKLSTPRFAPTKNRAHPVLGLLKKSTPRFAVCIVVRNRWWCKIVGLGVLILVWVC